MNKNIIANIKKDAKENNKVMNNLFIYITSNHQSMMMKIVTIENKVFKTNNLYFKN
jgi:hypothetical protein